MPSSTEAGGEARPADQETGEAGPGRRQPGPERRQRVAEAAPDERGHGTSPALTSLSKLPPPTLDPP